jgi:hypothetical protein
MGAYLRIGFVAKATATMPPNYSKAALNLELADFYSNNTFHCKASNDKITWTLKPKVIQTELVAFADEFYQDYLGRTVNMNRIQPITNTTEWLEQLIEKEDYRFQVDENNGRESFILEGDKRIHLHTTIVLLGSEGKFLMENCDCTLRFLRNSAQKAYSHFKLGKTIRVHVF